MILGFFLVKIVFYEKVCADLKDIELKFFSSIPGEIDPDPRTCSKHVRVAGRLGQQQTLRPTRHTGTPATSYVTTSQQQVDQRSI